MGTFVCPREPLSLTSSADQFAEDMAGLAGTDEMEDADAPAGEEKEQPESDGE